MFRVGDFVLCRYYTDIQYIAKITNIKNDFNASVDICCESNSKRTFEIESIDVEISRLSPIDTSLLV